MLLSYYTHGALCVLGETFHKLTLGKLLEPVDEIRAFVFDAANKTAVGQQVLAVAIEEDFSPEDADATLMQLVDGTMFAGLLGTGHLTTKTIERIRTDALYQVPLWNADRESYLLESARVDPPVTSVTAVLGEERTFDVASGTAGTGSVKVTLEKGSTMQLVISSANTDPDVFGGR